MKKIMVVALSVASCMLGSSSSVAAVVTVYEKGAVIATWDQSLTPSPLDYQTGYYTRVLVSNETGLNGELPDVAWYNSSHFGGLSDYDGNFDIFSSQAYIGPESAPIFQVGIYPGFDNSDAEPATFTISVPEPATWTMMLAGFGLAGLSMRRRRTHGVT